MSYPASQIINIATRISPQGLAFANFGSAMLFAPLAEAPGGFNADTYRTYFDLASLEDDFAASTETYKAAENWFGMVPAPRELMVYVRNNPTDTIVDTLNAARNLVWWYWSFFTVDVYNDEASWPGIMTWGDANQSYIINCSTAVDIRDPADATDISTVLTTQGSRHGSTFSHASDDYAGISLAAHFAAVNYSAARSTITGEFKKLPGVAAESLTGTEYAAMKQDTKKAIFYTQVNLQGSTDSGRVINSWSHSAYGEYIDDVVNLDAFVNDMTVTMYNALANQTTKLPQTPVGQSVLLAAAAETCERYVRNGYLGPRNYTDPDDGIEKFSVGYEILTKPEEILDLSDSDRGQRKSAPIRVRIFRAGAIHAVDISVDVY